MVDCDGSQSTLQPWAGSAVVSAPILVSGGQRFESFPVHFFSLLSDWLLGHNTGGAGCPYWPEVGRGYRVQHMRTRLPDRPNSSETSESRRILELSAIFNYASGHFISFGQALNDKRFATGLKHVVGSRSSFSHLSLQIPSRTTLLLHHQPPTHSVGIDSEAHYQYVTAFRLILELGSRHCLGSPSPVFPSLTPPGVLLLFVAIVSLVGCRTENLHFPGPLPR